MIENAVCLVLGLGMADEKGIWIMQRNKSFGRIRFRRVAPHSEAAAAGAIGVLELVQIAMKPISQKRC